MSSMSVSAYSTLAKRTGLSGLVSGLETEDIIEQYTSATRNRITSQLQKRQQEIWKQEMYQEITKKMQDFHTKYFSYSSSTNILSSKFFDVSNITSSSSNVKATGDSDAVQNMQIKNIKSLASASSFTSSHRLSDRSMVTGEILSNWQENSIASTSITFNVNGEDKTVSIGKDFAMSAAAMEVDAEGKLTDAAKDARKSELAAALNTAIGEAGLSGSIEAKITDNGKFSFVSADSSSVYIKSGSSALLSATGMKVGSADSASSEISANADFSATAMGGKEVSLSEKLSGTYISFSYNGISKNISFNESDKEQFSDAAGLASYLQKSLNTAFGKDKINVSETDGKLSFTTSDDSSVISVGYASTSGILSENGALKMVPGESNRAELNQTLDKIADSLSTPLVKDADGNYSMNINGVDLSFSGDTLLGDVITRINGNSDIGVKISYSSVTDTLSVKSTVMGTSGNITIADSNGSNLATALFGTQGTDYNIEQGTDFEAQMSFDGGKTFTDVVRTSNAFTVDDVTLTFTEGAQNVTEPITFTSEADTDAMYNKIKEFVDGYNEILGWMNTKVKESKYGRTSVEDTEEYLPLTDEQKEEMSEKEIEQWEEKAKTGLLKSDNNLYQISINMRRAMNDLIGDSGLGLYQIGIQTSSNWSDGGKLVIDETKLKEAIATNKDKVEQIFTQKDTGVAYRLQNVLKDAAVGNDKGDGLLVQLAGKPGNSSYQSIMSDRISNMTSRLTSLKAQLKNEEDRWWNKFSALETYISQMNQQASMFDFGNNS